MYCMGAFTTVKGGGEGRGDRLHGEESEQSL